MLWAFIRLSALATFSYPTAFILSQLSMVMQLVAFAFLSRLVHGSSSLGGGYLTFTAIGLASGQISGAGIGGLRSELDFAMQQGRFEMLLIEPLPWTILPIFLAAWPIISTLITAAVILFVAWAGFGASLSLFDAPALAAVVILGVATGLAVGSAAGAIRVIAKRADPIAALYGMASYVLSGVVFPINVLPFPLRVMAWVLPTTYTTSGMRKALMRHAGQVYGPSLAQGLLILAGMAIVFLPLSLLLFRRSLDTGRRYGLLAGY